MSNQIAPTLMTPTAVAKVLGVGPARVRQLDDALQPMRTTTGQRVYTAAAVERVAADREAARARGGK